MNKFERLKMLKAMEFIARQLNDEEIFNSWLNDGIPDGDIYYGDLIVNNPLNKHSWEPEVLVDDEEVDYFEYYMKDENFANIMDTFLWLMKRAHRSGGLYCDGVISHKD